MRRSAHWHVMREASTTGQPKSRPLRPGWYVVRWSHIQPPRVAKLRADGDWFVPDYGRDGRTAIWPGHDGPRTLSGPYADQATAQSNT